MEDDREYLEDMLEMMREFGQAQFGDAVRSYWVYLEPKCPCCLMREVDVLEIEGGPAVSLNGFMYRERGVLIGYFLCPVCARDIMRSSSVRWQMKLHQNIERNLIAAYKSFVASCNA